jgi:flagellar protein FlaG
MQIINVPSSSGGMYATPRSGPVASSSAEATSKSPRHTEALPAEEPRASGNPPAGLQDVKSKEQEQSRTVEDIRQAAERANAYLRKADTHLQFEVSERTGRIMISVIDGETEEVIRQIPPESMNRFAETMTHLRGLLFDTSG